MIVTVPINDSIEVELDIRTLHPGFPETRLEPAEGPDTEIRCAWVVRNGKYRKVNVRKVVEALDRRLPYWWDEIFR